MKIILLKEVKKLGLMGEIKEVADGYARNFLLPKKLVKIATPKIIAEIEMRARTKELRKQKVKKQENKLAHKLKGIDILEIPMKIVGARGRAPKLYASVSSQIISQALRDKGYEVPDKQIIIPKIIKRLGEHSVNLKLGGGNDVSLKLNVVAI